MRTKFLFLADGFSGQENQVTRWSGSCLPLSIFSEKTESLRWLSKLISRYQAVVQWSPK